MRMTGLSPDDLLRMVLVEDPVLAPSTGDVLYVRRWPHTDGRRYQSEIRRWSPAGDIAFTGGQGRDWAPRIAPDGTMVAFLSDRSGDVQLWVMPWGGGEARQLTHMASPPSPGVWAPDSRRLAFLAPEAYGPEREPGYAEDVVVVRRLHYRTNGERIHEERRRQVFVADLTGSIKRVTDGAYDYAFPAWSPDGRWLALVSRRAADADGALFRDLWRLEWETGNLTRLTENLVVQQPAWSPDGRHIAFIAHDGQFGRATCAHLWWVAADGHAPAAPVAPAWDVEIGSHVLSDVRGGGSLPGPLWTPDGREIWVVVDQGGVTRLDAVPVNGGSPRELLGGERTFYGLALDVAGTRYAVAASDPLSPGELSVGRIGGTEERITDANPWLAERTLCPPERFWCETPGGLQVEAWAMPPAGDRSAPHPTVLEIHGGPHAAYGATFMLEFQILAGQGIGVVYANPRGSTGYGQAHCTPVQDHWGIGAAEDVLAVLDAALERFSWMDASRLGVTGGSFGGYLTNWLLTRTDRFRAAIAQRSVSNRYSFVGTSDMGFRGIEEYGGPWANPEHYRDSSPIAYADRITTPLLLLHAEEDWRCPIEQAEQLFVALKMLGREVELVRYPGENHELSRNGRPYHRVDRLWRIARWFGQRL